MFFLLQPLYYISVLFSITLYILGVSILSSGIFSRLSRFLAGLFDSESTESDADSSAPLSDKAHKTTSVPKKKRRRPRKKKQAAASATPTSTPTTPQVKHNVGLSNKKSLGDWTVPDIVSRKEGKAYFQDFDLDKRLLKAIIDDLQFKACTPVQKLALPEALAGKDVTGKAQTGTGKTAVFLISIIQSFLHAKEESTDQEPRKPNQPFALVLAPTRELAIQIARDAEELSVYTEMHSVAVYGGMEYDRQKRLLNAGCDLVLATPGRLLDYLQQGALDLSKLKVLIIDEADRMLDMGFIPDVKRIIGYTPAPAQRQTMLFSATLSQDILNLASRWMRPDPKIIEIDPEQIVAKGIEEIIYACTSKEKLPMMLWLLQHDDCGRVLIFRNRRADVDYLHSKLLQYGIAAEKLSGDVEQHKRLRILEAFRQGSVKVIVATDVAGRGIHVDEVTHVFNYDLPYEAEDYVHRIGRTARAGQEGKAISFAGEDCAFVIPEIETYIGRSLPISLPEESMLQMPAAVKKPHAGIADDSKKQLAPKKSRRRSRRPRDGRVRRGGPRR